jgi:hypothetical protein
MDIRECENRNYTHEHYEDDRNKKGWTIKRGRFVVSAYTGRKVLISHFAKRLPLEENGCGSVVANPEVTLNSAQPSR